MLMLFGPVLLFVTSLVLLVLQRVRRRFRFAWPASFLVAAVAFVAVLIWQFQLPVSTALAGWGDTIPFPSSPAFSADSLSWTFALVVGGLLLAVVLVAPAWPDFQNSIGLPLTLAFFGIALLAVSADNIFTLVIVWAALDIAEVALTLHWSGGGYESRSAVLTFSARLASLMLALAAVVLKGGAANPASYPALIIAAAGLRLLVLPTRSAESAGAYVQGAVGVALQLASAATSLVVLSRIPLVDLASPAPELLLVLMAAAALYSGWMWLRTSDERSSRKFWILGLSFLAMGSALLQNPVGSAAWGLCLVLVGGSLFLSSARQRWLDRLMLLGAWALSALPFSLSGGGWSTAASVPSWIVPAFVLAQALLMAGFLHQATRPTRQLSIDAQPGWVRVAYMTGIALLLLMEVALGVWGWQGALQTQSALAGIIATPLGLLIFWGRSRIAALERLPGGSLPRGTPETRSLVQRIFAGLHATLRELIASVTRLFEGDAGIMWGLLVLVLIVSLIVGRSP
jgi:hypothetical protein